jgi:hypothetical protein
MTISVTHKKVSAVADTADTSLIQPSNWNDSHDLECAATSLLGNSAATAGAVTEIPFSTFAPATSGTDVLKGDGDGGTEAAIAGTDYLAPSAIGTTIDPAGTALALAIALG